MNGADVMVLLGRLWVGSCQSGSWFLQGDRSESSELNSLPETWAYSEALMPIKEAKRMAVGLPPCLYLH